MLRIDDCHNHLLQVPAQILLLGDQDLVIFIHSDIFLPILVPTSVPVHSRSSKNVHFHFIKSYTSYLWLVQNCIPFPSLFPLFISHVIYFSHTGPPRGGPWIHALQHWGEKASNWDPKMNSEGNFGCVFLCFSFVNHREAKVCLNLV